MVVCSILAPVIGNVKSYRIGSRILQAKFSLRSCQFAALQNMRNCVMWVGHYNADNIQSQDQMVCRVWVSC